MKRFRPQSLLALLVCLCLLWGMGGALAASGLDASLSRWLSPGEGALRFSGVLELGALLPFTEDQLPMFNALLKHASFQASLEEDGDGSLTSLQLLCGDTELFTLAERQQGDAYSLETNLLPGRTLTSRGGSPMALLQGAQEEASFDFLGAITQAQARYKALIDACEPFAEKKRANYKIKDIGTSKWSQIARLTTEQSDGMLPLLRAMLQSGMDEAYRRELEGVRFGKGFIVALYKAGENDRDLAVYMKGDLLYPDGSVHKLTYQWAFLNQGTERKDTYKYDAVKSGTPAARRTVAAKATQKLFSTEISLAGSSETTVKQGKDTAAQLFKFNLSGKEGEAGRSLDGSWSWEDRQTQGGNTLTVLHSYAPKLLMTPQGEGSLLSGTVQVEQKQGKTLTSSLTLTLGGELPQAFADLAQDSGLYAVQEPASDSTPLPASSMDLNTDQDPALQGEKAAAATPDPHLVGAPPIGLNAYPVPAQSTQLSLDSLSGEGLEALLAELSQNLAGRLLKAFAGLPAEDTALLTDGLTPEDAAAFLGLIAGL